MFAGGPLLLALLIYAVVAGLSGSSPRATTPPTTAKKSTPLNSNRADVGVRSFVFVDTSRSTYDYATGKTTPGRHIGVEVRYLTHAGSSGTEDPNAAVAQHRGSPMILFAPGYRLRAEDYTSLLDAWVRDGYLVAALQFPDTTYPQSDVPYRAGLPHGLPETDLYNEPADVDFALRRLLAASATSGNWLKGLVNARSVVLAGHSDGATALAALVYDSNDQVSGLAVRAVTVLSGGELPISKQVYAQPSSAVPLLVVQSATDVCNPPWEAVQLYNALSVPKYLIELNDATHLGAYDGAQAAPSAVVTKATTAFFDEVLGRNSSSVADLRAAGTTTGVSSFTDVAVAGAIPTPTGSTSCPAD